MNVKRLLSLLFALALATTLSFAQSTSSDQSSTDQSTTTTKKKKSKVHEAASATGEAAKDAASATAEGTEKVASATAKGTKKAAKTTKNAVTGESSSSKKLDLNSATKEELATLPGVGDATAQKIIDGRPYRAKNELVSKSVVTQSQYDQIKDQVIAHHAKTAATASTSSDNAGASGSVSSSTGTPKKSTKPAAPK